ncbi:protein GRAVITROPIC IN THE LIGHT 1-like isoform X2 [Andrographis paniculata]|uniref:protein GRAVITROPIC IN THE LIGHT 1-like isoform X2 n=1 Tax=Andrographis paniculata TaxID=175694 RepID=UPI0021E9A288|nr:protein GRAVITROPIC IN THE LIGHT 1-like isoform X2 [Andrographis paniculata]
MDSTVATPRKSRLARAFAKVMHIRAVTGAASERGVFRPTDKKTASKKAKDEEGLVCSTRARREAFLAKLFASISTVKAAYAQLQFSQSPYDGEGIQIADEAIVSELKSLSELKQAYLKNNLLDDKTPPPGTALLLSEIREQKSLLKTYQVTGKKLEFELRLKDSEITFLKEKLAEAVGENRLLERRANLCAPAHSVTETGTGTGTVPDPASRRRRPFHSQSHRHSHLISSSPSHFIMYHKLAVKSIRAFVRMLVAEIQESTDWDLEAAARSIVPGTPFWKSSHICFAFESFVCQHMFDGFGCPMESISPPQLLRHHLFDYWFMEMASVRDGHLGAWKPGTAFAQFCRSKYLRLVHSKMEAAIFGNLDQRNMVSSGGEMPDTPFVNAFIEMAKDVWLLHCLALSFDPTVEIFQVKKGVRFSEVYMESLSEEALDASTTSSRGDANPCVAFVVAPGFRIGATIVVQCQVYLR